MSGPVFLLAAAIACSTILMIVKTIAAATTGRRSSSDLGQIREQFEHHAAILDETQATLATQSAQLAELQERLDFTERLLAQTRDRTALAPGETGK